jgi:hypothetical protein
MASTKPLRDSKSASVKFPSIKNVAERLGAIKARIGPNMASTAYLDVHTDGTWAVSLLNEGNWTTYKGRGRLGHKTNCRELARELIDQARDHYAQSAPEEEKPAEPVPGPFVVVEYDFCDDDGLTGVKVYGVEDSRPKGLMWRNGIETRTAAQTEADAMNANPHCIAVADGSIDPVPAPVCALSADQVTTETEEDESEEEDFIDEPQEDDIFTDDYRRFYQNGKPVVEVPEDEDWMPHVLAHVEKDGFYPNVWHTSDHGNQEIISVGKHGVYLSDDPLPPETVLNLAALAAPETDEMDTVVIEENDIPRQPRTPTAEDAQALLTLQQIMREGEKPLERFVNAYVACALWSSTDQTNEQGGESLDRNYDARDIAPVTMLRIVKECLEFSILCEDDIAQWDGKGTAEEQAGHDFWLTRNGHGAGFWDGDWPEGAGQRLTDASKCYGEINLYADDDGLLYLS